MKTHITVLLLMVGLGSTRAQKLKETEVPAPVKSSFEKQYPGIKVEKWEKEGNFYEAEFDVKKVETSAVYEADGTFLESEVEISVSELPKSVHDYVAKSLAGKKVKEASKITHADGKISYEAEVDKIDYIFDTNGNLIKKETDGEKDDDKD